MSGRFKYKKAKKQQNHVENTWEQDATPWKILKKGFNKKSNMNNPEDCENIEGGVNQNDNNHIEDKPARSAKTHLLKSEKFAFVKWDNFSENEEDNHHEVEVNQSEKIELFSSENVDINEAPTPTKKKGSKKRQRSEVDETETNVGDTLMENQNSKNKKNKKQVSKSNENPEENPVETPQSSENTDSSPKKNKKNKKAYRETDSQAAEEEFSVNLKENSTDLADKQNKFKRAKNANSKDNLKFNNKTANLKPKFNKQQTFTFNNPVEQSLEQDSLQPTKIEKRCFACRGTGHSVKQCQKFKNETNEICIKCGAKDHSYQKCTVYKGQVFKFAQCFICSQKGHISSQCTEKKNGIYPDGGSCRECGSVDHFVFNCPVRRAKRHSNARRKFPQARGKFPHKKPNFQNKKPFNVNRSKPKSK